MRKKLIAALAVAVVAVVAGYNVYSSQKSVTMSDLALANVEALAGNESGHKYATKDEKTIEVIDDATGMYHKITVIDCQGDGILDC